MLSLNFPLTIVFALAAVWAVLASFKASRSSNWLIVAVIWLAVQGGLSLAGFYQHQTMPPRMAIITFPPLVFVVTRLLSRGGRNFLEGLDLTWCLAYHLVRIPVEIGLYLLAKAGKVPLSMTFEAGNFDIFSGISVVVILFLFLSRRLKPNLLFVWNTICLSLLLYIMVTANLSAPGPMHHINFDHPNIGFGFFPAVWLPSFIAPMALMCHLAIYVKLFRQRGREEGLYS